MSFATPFPRIDRAPEVTRDQMIEVDRLMIENMGISLVQMMENAGRSLALVARDLFLDGDAAGKSVAVLAGSGGNGGGALTAARRLAIWGANISIGMTRPRDGLAPVPRRQFDILNKVTSPTEFDPGQFPKCDLVIDGLIGYSLAGAPKGRTAEFITSSRSLCAPVLSLDVPSGFDAVSGAALEPVIRAEATLTLALPKSGMQQPENASKIGRLFCADISVPPSLYSPLNISMSDAAIFSNGDIVEIVPIED